MNFVNANIYHKAKRLALSERLPPEHFQRHEQSGEFQQKATYIPIDFLFEIYELADEHLVPGFGLRQGRQLDSGDYGTLGLSWRTCWRAREILDRTERFMILVTDHGSIRVEENKGFTKVILFRDANRIGVQVANEATFVMITSVLSEVTGMPITPVNVQFKHGSNAVEDFKDFFQCPVSFDHNVYSIQFRTADVDIPTIKADQSIHQFLVERMNEEMRGIHANTDRLLGNIHKLIVEALPGGIPSVIQVAEYLGMSPRTLKRRLSEKGLTFRDLVQKIQQDVSLDLIKNSPLSMAEIAFQTGFSEQSAFNRAFKRWTGESPADFRKSS